LAEYLTFYNEERFHQSLQYKNTGRNIFFPLKVLKGGYFHELNKLVFKSLKIGLDKGGKYKLTVKCVLLKFLSVSDAKD